MSERLARVLLVMCALIIVGVAFLPVTGELRGILAFFVVGPISLWMFDLWNKATGQG